MTRSVDYLNSRCRWVAVLCIVALACFASALLLVAWLGGQAGPGWMDALIGCLLAGVALPSFAAMLSATVVVVRNRRNLVDWGMFLIFIWCLPYLGIALYLGSVAAYRQFRRRDADASSVDSPRILVDLSLDAVDSKGEAVLPLSETARPSALSMGRSTRWHSFVLNDLAVATVEPGQTVRCWISFFNHVDCRSAFPVGASVLFGDGVSTRGVFRVKELEDDAGR